LRLTTNWTLVDCWTGRSAGFSPFEDAIDIAQRLVPKGTILLLVSCPMSARPNHGIPDL
jgi:hypothetical protein